MILTGIMDLAVNVFRKEGHGEIAVNSLKFVQYLKRNLEMISYQKKL